MNSVFEQQLADIVSDYSTLLAQSNALNRTIIADLRTRCLAAVERASGSTSPYYMSIVEFRKQAYRDIVHLEKEVGVARALLSDIQNDYLKSFEELLHGDLFGDYLEMATHLLDNNYKDAAAVIVGSTLEVHIKKLCNKHNINAERGGKSKKADELNSELAKQGVYSKLDQKSVTGWLGLRNHAAHGHYSEYSKEQVALNLQSVQDFITRHPA